MYMYSVLYYPGSVGTLVSIILIHIVYVPHECCLGSSYLGSVTLVVGCSSHWESPSKVSQDLGRGGQLLTGRITPFYTVRQDILHRYCYESEREGGREGEEEEREGEGERGGGREGDEDREGREVGGEGGEETGL